MREVLVSRKNLRNKKETGRGSQLLTTASGYFYVSCVAVRAGHSAFIRRDAATHDVFHAQACLRRQ